jgi:hypothetical protein
LVTLGAIKVSVPSRLIGHDVLYLHIVAVGISSAACRDFVESGIQPEISWMIPKRQVDALTE